MTKVFEKMLYLFGDGTRGKISNIDIGNDLEEIRKIAIRHSVWQTVYLALPEAYKKIYNKDIMVSVSKNIQRNAFIIGIIEKIKSNGINVTLIKGLSVSRLYKEPELRISGDTDILIDKNKENAVKKILAKSGFTVFNREAKSHHFIAIHPLGGILETHIKLYDKSAQKFLFYPDIDGEDEYMEFDYMGKTIKTLGINNGLQFLFVHYIRHFVAEGVGVRQLMDLLLYMEHFADEIDNEKLAKALKEFRYEKLMSVLKAIGNKYLGFNFENACYDDVAERLLLDVEEGGTFGSGKNIDFYKHFLHQRAETLDISSRSYWTKRKLIKFWERIFPSSFVMRNNGYDYAKNLGLLCVAYLHRFGNIVIRVFGKGKQIKRKIKTRDPENRMNLMKDLEII